MTPEQWRLLPIRLGALCVVTGIVLIFGLNFLAGGQALALTQLPYALAAAGAGIGLVVLGLALSAAQRRRLDRLRVEEAAARLLVAAARLSEVRSAGAERSAAAAAQREHARFAPPRN